MIGKWSDFALTQLLESGVWGPAREHFQSLAGPIFDYSAGHFEVTGELSDFACS